MSASSSSPALDQALPIGVMLHEYRIEEVLGVGAFGITYRGTDVNLENRVAIKEFFPADHVLRRGQEVALKDQAEADVYRFGLEAFVSEARLLAKFRHPNIVHILRYFNANNTAYFVMEYEEGRSLADALQQGATFDEARLMSLLEGILDGLKCVHDLKYIHGDLKPSNVYLRQDAVPVLIDFGAAKSDFLAALSPGLCALTHGYAAIELYDETIAKGPWTDFYALGATLYRCLFGAPPKEAPVRQYARDNGLPDPCPTARELAAGRCSPAFLGLIDWMLALRPEERPVSVGQIKRYLSKGALPTNGDPATILHIYQARKLQRGYRLLFAGPRGIGKTKAISALTAGLQSAVRLDAPGLEGVSLPLSEQEWLEMCIWDGGKAALADDRSRAVLLGLVILVDGSQPDALDLLALILRKFAESSAKNLTKTPIAIGLVNDAPSAGESLREKCRLCVEREIPGRALPAAPVFHVDPAQRKDMLRLCRALLLFAPRHHERTA